MDQTTRLTVLDLANRIPADALGKARSFRNRVAAENDRYLQASWRMVEPISARLKRFPSRDLRPAMLRGFEREWRVRMPQEFSVDLDTEWSRHGVRITERRITVADFCDDNWTEGYREPEVSIGSVTVTLNRTVATVTFTTKAIIPLTALARRVQWGWDSNDAALIGDIVTAGAFDVAAIPEGAHVTIPIEGDGVGWRARAVLTLINDERTERVIVVRDWWR